MVLELIIASIIVRGRIEILHSSLFLIGAVICLPIFGFMLGYFFSKLVSTSKEVNRPISIEVGMQNSVLGAYLARTNFANPVIAIPSEISSATHTIIGSIAAAVWRNR